MFDDKEGSGAGVEFSLLHPAVRTIRNNTRDQMVPDDLKLPAF